MTRRDFLKATSAVAAALGLTSMGLPGHREAEGAEGAPQVVWLQGQGCTGCSVSLLNSIYYMTADNLLLNTIDLEYHSTLMAAAGGQAVAAAMAARNKRGYILAVEGAIPTGANGRYSMVWDGMTMHDAVRQFGANAAYVLSIGTCASFGGMAAGKPNPTNAKPVRDIVSGKPIINIPGCPANPDWVVGTVAYILKNGRAPALDGYGRPRDYYGTRVHDRCPRREYYEEGKMAAKLGEQGCLIALGCRGKESYCDCPTRKWNSGAAATPGVNWCIGAGGPCIGCTSPNFPDGNSPFYHLEYDGTTGATTSTGGGSTGGETDDD